MSAALADLNFPRGYLGRRTAFEREQSDQMAQLNLVLMSIVFVFLLTGVLFESCYAAACVYDTHGRNGCILAPLGHRYFL